MTETSESELVITVLDDEPRPECSYEPCHNEALWRCIFAPCGHGSVVCNPCKEITEKELAMLDIHSLINFGTCLVCFGPVQFKDVTWERL